MTELMTGPQRRRVDDPNFQARLNALIDECGGDSGTRDGRLIRELLLTSLKLITDGRTTGELKLLAHSFKETRHAYRVFGDYDAAVESAGRGTGGFDTALRAYSTSGTGDRAGSTSGTGDGTGSTSGTGDRTDSIRGLQRGAAATQGEVNRVPAIRGAGVRTPRISIFGSARTPTDHPDYRTAVDFSRRMADLGWLVITGAGDGIMKAGHEGPGAESSFGLAIRLPFETTANTVIAGDRKLMHFRYFFTRKLMFLSQSDAIAAFPGGFGTQDELLEALTLIQTGKSAIVPVVLIEAPGSRYWTRWEEYVRDEFLAAGLISPSDTSLYYRATDPADAAAHVARFYAGYHSSRYVGDDLVIRIREPLRPRHVAQLNSEFASLVRRGEIVQCPAYVQEEEHLDLPRIAFTHTRRDYGLVRRLIDRINDLAIDSGAAPQPLAPPHPADRARVLNWRSHRISTLRARPRSR